MAKSDVITFTKTFLTEASLIFCRAILIFSAFCAATPSTWKGQDSFVDTAPKIDSAGKRIMEKWWYRYQISRFSIGRLGPVLFRFGYRAAAGSGRESELRSNLVALVTGATGGVWLQWLLFKVPVSVIAVRTDIPAELLLSISRLSCECAGCF